MADRRYADDLSVADLAREAALSKAHFSREFADAFGASPHQYLRARRLERAASLLRNTDRSITDICMAVGLSSVGSFVTAFGRSYGTTPAAYRSSFPPARRHIRVPSCVARTYGIPNSTFEEATDRSDP